jgi:hypothetical protein
VCPRFPSASLPKVAKTLGRTYNEVVLGWRTGRRALSSAKAPSWKLIWLPGRSGVQLLRAGLFQLQVELVGLDFRYGGRIGYRVAGATGEQLYHNLAVLDGHGSDPNAVAEHDGGGAQGQRRRAGLFSCACPARQRRRGWGLSPRLTPAPSPCTS